MVKFIVLLFLCISISNKNLFSIDKAGIIAKSKYFEDYTNTNGTIKGHTETIINERTGSIVEKTFDKNKNLVLKTIYEKDRFGKKRLAYVYDNQDKLVFKIIFGYNKYGKISEKRFYNTKKELIKRTFYRYKADGTAKAPVSVTYIDENGNVIEKK